MKSSKEILENLIDALLAAEPVLDCEIRPLLRRANEDLSKIESLSDELSHTTPAA